MQTVNIISYGACAAAGIDAVRTTPKG